MVNKHPMITRSKSLKENESILNNDKIIDKTINDELDEHGNLKDFIVYDGNTLKKDISYHLNSLKKDKKNKKDKKDKKRKLKKNEKLNTIFLSYLIQKATNKANKNLKKKRKDKKKII